MRRPHFAEQLAAAQRITSPCCASVSIHCPSRSLPAFEGLTACRVLSRIVDSVADLVCAFKPQFAHFAALGAERELAS